MNNNYHLLFKYILVGDANAGKSSLLMRFLHGKFNENYQTTLGVEFGAKTFSVGATDIKAMIWDTAGQQSFRSITRSYYNAIIAILVYDVTNEQSFGNLPKWIEQLKANASEQLRIVIVGNKIDANFKRTVQRTEAEQYASSLNLLYIETSAKTGQGVQECFLSPARQLLQDIESKKINLGSGNEYVGIKTGNPSNHRQEPIQIAAKTLSKEKCSC